MPWQCRCTGFTTPETSCRCLAKSQSAFRRSTHSKWAEVSHNHESSTYQVADAHANCAIRSPADALPLHARSSVACSHRATHACIESSAFTYRVYNYSACDRCLARSRDHRYEHGHAVKRASPVATGALGVDANRTQPAEALLSGNAEPSNAQQFVRDVISIQASVVSINYVACMRLAEICHACVRG